MFKNILGQESVIATLSDGLINDHLAQTFLFSGEHQIGKTTTAIELAKAILCIQRLPGSADSCDRCTACKEVEAGQHPDVRIVGPSGPSRIIRIAQFWPRDGVKDHPADRAMLRDLHFAPVSGKRRIFIVEAAENMNEDTSNSLLKVLEEPPPYATFILTSVSTEAMLPTILSRSQTLRFRPVPEPAIKAELMRRGVSTERAEILAAYSQGRPGIALRASTSDGNMAGRDEVLKTAVESSSSCPPVAAFRIADDLRKASAKLTEPGIKIEDVGARSLLTSACDILLMWYRDLLVRKATNGVGRVLNADLVTTIDKQINRYTVADLEKAINLIQDTRRYIGRNANAQIATEYLILNLLSLGK